jgi:hypothetical protein
MHKETEETLENARYYLALANHQLKKARGLEPNHELIQKTAGDSEELNRIRTEIHNLNVAVSEYEQ